MRQGDRFAATYGPWALVAGASAGLGAAFAERIAQRNTNLVLLARRERELETLAHRLTGQYAVEVRPVAIDLGTDGFLDALAPKIADIDIGLLVYNATFPAIGEFLAQPLRDHLKLIDVNCRAPVALVHALAAPMKKRATPHQGTVSQTARRSGIVLMSSLTAFQGTPYISHYGASKAYILALGEGLAYELKSHDIDLVVSCPGATLTENFIASVPRGRSFTGVPTMNPEDVAERTLRALGKRTVYVPGTVNTLASFFMRRILGRKTAVRIMAASAKKLYGER